MSAQPDADAARAAALGAVRVRERAISHLLACMYGDAASSQTEHETMASYVDALLEAPDLLRELADVFAPAPTVP